MLKYRLPGRYIHLRKEILIMKDKPIKQPWPRSAKVTVWVLSILLSAAVVYAYVAATANVGDYVIY